MGSIAERQLSVTIPPKLPFRHAVVPELRSHRGGDFGFGQAIAASA